MIACVRDVCSIMRLLSNGTKVIGYGARGSHIGQREIQSQISHDGYRAAVSEYPDHAGRLSVGFAQWIGVLAAR